MSKLAVITGVGGVLGRACAKALAKDGWLVAGGGRTSPQTPVEGLSFFVQMDASQASSIEAAFRAIQTQTGMPATLFIHAAGVTRDSLIVRQEATDWDALQAVHLRGAWLCTKAVWPGMVQAGGGHVLLVSSHAAHLGGVGQSAYAAAKAGMIGLAQSLAREGASSNIRVNTVCPGLLRSPMTELLNPDQRGRLLEANLLKRFNDPEEVSLFVAWLAGSRQISAQIFYLDSRPVSW